MSLDPPSASPSRSEDSREPGLAALVRERGAPLLDALEEHLPGSREHADAAATLTLAAGPGLGLQHAVAELYAEATRLHDVGMVYVPRDIALTPHHQLGEEGLAAFAAHYEAGAKLALGAGIPDDVCDWLRRVCERFDGAGPEGLSGQAIPIASRLMRAACALDLLLRSEPGAGDAARDRALARLRSASGAELDPAAVEALAASAGG